MTRLLKQLSSLSEAALANAPGAATDLAGHGRRRAASAKAPSLPSSTDPAFCAKYRGQKLDVRI